MSFKEIMVIEDKIAKIIQKEGNTIHFKKDWVEPYRSSSQIGQLADVHFERKMRARVQAFTLNSNTKETFLLKEVTGEDHLECYSKILDYVEHTKLAMNTFTVNWSKKENGTLGSYNTSYFYCQDVTEVIKKFFDGGKDVSDYVIYEIKLNPIS